ncbi:uncharacterized protein LOC113636854 isoform X1 [Tachysurus ichikawai]
MVFSAAESLRALERGKTIPPTVQCLIAKEAVCHEPVVIRCRQCLPEDWFCGDCDALSTRYLKTCQRLQDETARLNSKQSYIAQMNWCHSGSLIEFVFTINSTETPDTSHASQGTTHRGLQQSIEGLYLSVRQQKQALYRQNGITM